MKVLYGFSFMPVPAGLTIPLAMDGIYYISQIMNGLYNMDLKFIYIAGLWCVFSVTHFHFMCHNYTEINELQIKLQI